MAESAKQQTIPEDETFLSDEDLFEQAYREKHGLEPEEPEQRADDGEAAPERDASDDEGELLSGESAEREAEPEEAKKREEPEEPEWMKDLTEDAKQAYLAQQQELANLRNQYNAVHNRLAPVQQENARLRQQLSNASSSPAQGQNSGAVPVGQSQPQTKFSLDDVEEFKEFREAFPDEAKAMEAAFARQAQYVGNLESQLVQVQQGMQDIQRSSFETKRQTELSRLSEAHPDWMTVRPSEDFNRWLERQPSSISSLANSSSADDCIWILDRYKADMYVAQQFSQQEEPKEQPQRSDGRAQQTRSRRQQLRSVPNPPPQQDGGVGAPQMGGAPMSEEEIWAQEVERRLRAQREANR